MEPYSPLNPDTAFPPFSFARMTSDSANYQKCYGRHFTNIRCDTTNDGGESLSQVHRVKHPVSDDCLNKLLLGKSCTPLCEHQLEDVAFLCITLPLHLELLLHDSLTLVTSHAIASLRIVIREIRHSVDDSEEDVVKQLLELAPPQAVRAVRRTLVCMVQEAGLALDRHAAGRQKQARLELAQANDLACANLSLLEA